VGTEQAIYQGGAFVSPAEDLLMTANPVRLLRHLRRASAASAAQSASDAVMLERFRLRQDEEAFAVLVARHGPMVRRLCGRILANTQDAEDAFQATFLVLARKAAIVRPQTLASWLHGVAYRVACKARGAVARRRFQPLPLDMPDPLADPPAEVSAREVLTLFDEELRRLPEVYRLPIILCCLQGRSQEEAARQLGWTPGSLQGRLERARARLHARLARRGVSFAAGMLVLEAVQGVAPAVPPPAGFVASLLQAARLSTPAMTGHGAVTPRVLTLAQETMQSMTAAKMKMGLVLFLVTSVVVAGAGLIAPQARQESQPQEQSKASKQQAPQPSANAKAAPLADRFGDPLPAGAVARLGTRRLCGPDDAMWLRFSPDGSKIASQGLFVLTVWDAVSGKRLVERINYDSLVNGMAWRKDGTGVALVRLPDLSYFVSVFTDANEKLPNPPPAPLPKTFPVPGPEEIKSLALSPDATRLAVVRNPNEKKITIDLLTVTTGRCVSELKRERTLGPFDGPCEEVRFFAAGQLMILSSPPKNEGDWSVTIVDPDANRAIRTARIPPPGYCIWRYMLDLSADARLAAVPPRGTGSTNDHDGTMRVWDLDARKEIWSLPFPQRGYGTGHAFTPDGKRLITSTDKVFFQIWDLETGKEVARSSQPVSTFGREASTVAVRADGKRFATARRDGRVEIWDAQTGKSAVSFAKHYDSIAAVAASPDSRLAATLGFDGYLRTWDVATGQAKDAIPAPSDNDSGGQFRSKHPLAFTPDGRGLLFRSAGKLTLADPNTGKRLSLPDALSHWPGHVGEFSADGRTLATFNGDKVTLWDWPTANLRAAFTVPLSPQRPAGVKEGPERVEVNSVALSADGRLVFTNSTRRQNSPRGGGYQNSNDVWDGRTGKHLHRLTTPEPWYPPGVFSPDGRELYLGGLSLNFEERPTADALTAWDPATGTLLRRFAEPERGAGLPRHEPFGRSINSLAVSPDGRLLAVAQVPHSPGDFLWLYETASGRIIKALFGHVRNVMDLAFTPDGRRLVSVSEDQTGLVWDVTLPALADAVSAKQLAPAWDQLAEFDPKSAYKTMAALAANPREAIVLLREKLRPAPVPTDAELDRLIAQFDAAAFADRQKAWEEMERFGPNAVDGIKARLKRLPTLEVRKRLLLFLDKYDGPNPHQLRCVRAVAVLEAIHTPEARALLAKLTKGPPNDALTREAQAASRRARE
jgi:RNA polymerase sigma factor (sigma-70 family)